jgi:hypothetical protein
MLNDLPEEIIIMIINASCQRPTDYIDFKRINKRCSSIIETIDNSYIHKINDYEEEINNFCSRNTSVSTFDWFFRNDIVFTLKNMKLLIINDRLDVLQQGNKYNYFSETLFHRLYMNHVENKNDIFSIVESINPLIIAAENNRIGIIRMLLAQKQAQYPRLLPELLEISIKYTHENLLSYLIVNHLPVVERKIQDKLLPIIYRIKNCEEILFYLLKNIKVKIKIYPKHLFGFISANYNKIFKYVYRSTEYDNAFKMELVSRCLSDNNIDIFSFIFDEIKETLFEKESSLLFEKQDTFYTGKKELLYHILNNYSSYIGIESKLLRTCILNGIDETTICKFVDLGYHFKKCDMKLVLENQQFALLEKMCREIQRK